MSLSETLRCCIECSADISSKQLRAIFCSGQCKSKYHQRGRVKTKEDIRRDNLRKYGVTPEQVSSMAEEQEQRCLICKKETVVLCVDHCHQTGVVRGLLCHACNLGIGIFQDDPQKLRDAADYIESSKEK